MHSNTIEVEALLQTLNVKIEETSPKMNLEHVFAPRKDYLNELNLFIAHFNTIPNVISEMDIDCKKANNWFCENYKGEINKHYFSKRYFNRNKQAELDDIFYILFDDLIVDFDTHCSIVRFLFSKQSFQKLRM